MPFCHYLLSTGWYDFIAIFIDCVSFSIYYLGLLYTITMAWKLCNIRKLFHLLQNCKGWAEEWHIKMKHKNHSGNDKCCWLHWYPTIVLFPGLLILHFWDFSFHCPFHQKLEQLCHQTISDLCSKSSVECLPLTVLVMIYELEDIHFDKWSVTSLYFKWKSCYHCWNVNTNTFVVFLKYMDSTQDYETGQEVLLIQTMKMFLHHLLNVVANIF